MHPAKLIYTIKAEDDLDSIFDYIDKIKSAIEHLATSPFIGVHCRPKGIDRDCRILIFENYLVFYQFNEIDNEIKILRILHGSRKYQDLLK